MSSTKKKPNKIPCSGCNESFAAGAGITSHQKKCPFFLANAISKAKTVVSFPVVSSMKKIAADEPVVDKVEDEDEEDDEDEGNDEGEDEDEPMEPAEEEHHEPSVDDRIAAVTDVVMKQNKDLEELKNTIVILCQRMNDLVVLTTPTKSTKPASAAALASFQRSDDLDDDDDDVRSVMTTLSHASHSVGKSPYTASPHNKVGDDFEEIPFGDISIGNNLRAKVFKSPKKAIWYRNKNGDKKYITDKINKLLEVHGNEDHPDYQAHLAFLQANNKKA